MILDFHTHAFPGHLADKAVGSLARRAGIKNYTDGSLAALTASMEIAGVTHSVLCNIVVKPGQEEKTNAFALEALERFQRGESPYVIPLASVNPFSPDWQQWLHWVKEKGFPGIKLHPNYQKFYIDDPQATDFYRKAHRLGLLILFHAGFDDGFPEPDYASVERSANVLPLLEQGKTVLAHMGDYTRPEAVLELLAGSGVYLDLSLAVTCLNKERLGSLVKKHTPDRILFATDSPWMGQKESLACLREKLGDQMTEADMQKILWKNGAKLLGLER